MFIKYHNMWKTMYDLDTYRIFPTLSRENNNADNYGMSSNDPKYANGYLVWLTRQDDYVVIDIDEDNEFCEQITDMCKGKSMEVCTGSGKRHFWFRCTDKRLSSKRSRVNGIDIIGNGGVYGVGSNLAGIKDNHYKEYEIIGDNESIEPMPENIKTYLINAIKQPKKEIKTTMNTIKEGTRNIKIFNLVAALSKNSIQRSHIHGMSHHFNKFYCDPPLPKTEVDDIVSRHCIERPSDKPIKVLVNE